MHPDLTPGKFEIVRHLYRSGNSNYSELTELYIARAYLEDEIDALEKGYTRDVTTLSAPAGSPEQTQ